MGGVISMLFGCIFVPNFPVAAVLRAEPELRTQALAITHGKPPLENILAVNLLAETFGIAPGMTRAQSEICSGLALRPRSTLREAATHAALLDAAQSFSPLLEDTAIDTVLLDLTGSESLFGPPPILAGKIARLLTQFALEGRVALASNPDTALLAARGFPGVTVIPHGKEAERLGSLSVEVLFANAADDSNKNSTHENSLLDILDRWGVRTLRSLAALPEISLSERLGQHGLTLRRLASGLSHRTLTPFEPALHFEEAIELEHPIVLLEPLSFLLNRLLEQLCERMAARALAAQELRLTLELADSSSRNQQSAINNQQYFHRTLRLPLPMLDAKLFLKLLQLDLNAHPPGAPIIKIFLAADPAPPRPAQGSLFQPPAPEPEKLELTLARIRGLVGEQQAGSPRLLDTHRDGTFQMQAFEVTESASAQKLSEPSHDGTVSSSLLPMTALRRFRPPLCATVTLEQGQPARLSCPALDFVASGQACLVLWKAGPWRSSGDWWQHDAWARDEWDIALQNADRIALYRLVHDLLASEWFVEGTYD
jgi:protein ImuB